MRNCSIAGILFLFIAFSPLAVQGQDFDIVYALNFFDGVTYSSTLVPNTAGEIFIHEDHVNAFVVRETVLYYWPLTSEFRADWASRNVPLQGTLNIRDRQGNIMRIEAQRYTIQYDMNDIPGTIGIYWGTEADAKHAEFSEAQRDYSYAIHAYNAAMQLYQQIITDIMLNPPDTNIVFPEVPMRPANFTIMSTGLNIGFSVKLPRGNYSIFFETSEGNIIPETRKRLRVFGPRERVGGFQVFEEGRWTVPSNFPDSRMSLFTVPGSVIYLQPFNYLHYEARAYNLMMNPQNRFNRSESSTWVPASLNTDERQLNINGQNHDLYSYDVVQVPGSRLGYIINPTYLGDPESSFTAFKFTAQTGSEGKRYNIGQMSSISVLRVFMGVELIIIIISLLPLAFFIIVIKLFRRSW